MSVSGRDINDDELFEEIIEIDYGFAGCEGVENNEDEDDDDKENQNRSMKATKVQFKKIEDFMKEHGEASIEKILWNELASELNSLGPPKFTASQWKFKWSQHKYNKKRKLSTSATEIAGISDQEKQPQSLHLLDPVQNIESTAAVNSILEIADKLDVIIQNQNVILQTLQRGNNLLQEISNSFKKQNL